MGGLLGSGKGGGKDNGKGGGHGDGESSEGGGGGDGDRQVMRSDLTLHAVSCHSPYAQRLYLLGVRRR